MLRAVGTWATQGNRELGVLRAIVGAGALRADGSWGVLWATRCLGTWGNRERGVPGAIGTWGEVVVGSGAGVLRAIRSWGYLGQSGDGGT